MAKDRRNGWGPGSYRLATICGWAFSIVAIWLLLGGYTTLGVICGIAAVGSYLKASERAKGARLARWEHRLQRLVR